MILGEVLRQATQTLSSQNIEEPRLEAELLLRHALGISQVQLYLRLDEEISSQDVAAFTALLERRLRHEPIAYVIEHKEFFGIDFYVDYRVLIPRPESELLVEQAIELGKGHPSLLIAEVGTGSGAIAIALALHLPQAEIYAIDLSPMALEVAALNSRKHKVADRVTLLEGDMLAPLPISVELIVANLPYVKDADLSGLTPEVRLFEPRLALAGGSEGLDEIGRLLSQTRAKLKPGGAILLETASDQSQKVKKMAKSHFPETEAELVQDLSGVCRALRIKLPC